MSNFIKVDVSSLSSYQNDFNNEHNYFNNKTYTTFTSGYLKSCGDQYINQMASHLKSYYERVEIGYRNINTWWTGYVNDVEALEKLLSGEGNAAGIEEPAVISAIAKLFNIDTYENTLDGTFGEQGGDYSSAFSFDDQSAIDMANANVFGENPEGKYVTLADRIYNFITSEGAKLKEALTESCVDVYNEDGTLNVWNICKNAYTIYKNKVKLEKATAAAVGLSAGEGLLKLGEAFVDLGAITQTIAATGPTALIDGVQALYGMATGKEWKSVTKEMWNNTKTFVAKDHVKTWFDNFYENTNIGKSIKENAFEFDTIRNVTTGISYGIGIVGLTVATMGVGGIAIAGSQAATSAAIATAAGIGKCTQNAWADGAGIVEGLEAGALGGGWEGLQYYIGGKINQFNPFGGTGTASKYLNIGTRAFLDGVDGGAESFVLPAIDAIYKDGYTDASGNYVSFTEKDNFFSRYSNLFESNGGAKGALTNATVGAGISLGSELFDVFKKPKSDVEVIDPDPVLKTPKQELPPNQTIIDTEGHLVDFDYETLDGDIIEDYPSGSFSGEAAKNYSSEIEKLAGVDRKGLPAGPDEVGLATNEPKNLGSGAAEKIDIFEGSEIPKAKVKTDTIDLDDKVPDSKSITNVDSNKSNINPNNGLTSNSKNLTGDVSTEKLDIFEESKIPKTEVKTDAIDTEKIPNIPKRLTKTDAKGNLYTIPTLRELTPKEIEALKEFEFYMGDGKSSTTVVGKVSEALTKSMKYGNDDAYYYLKAINKLKTINPDLNFSTCGDAISHWSRSNLSLQLDDEAILGNHFSISYHESGHMLWNLINGETLPNNWDDIVRRAQTHASEDARFGRTIFNLDIQYNDLVDTARRKFSDMIFQTKNMSLSEYYSSLKNKYVGELSQSGNITGVLRKAGLDDNSINLFFSSNGKISLDDLATYAANTEYNNVLFKFQTNLAYTEYPALVAESDMINAVYKTKRYQNGTNFLHFGHPDGYYTRDAISSLHELIANFTELKLINDIPSQSAIYEFKELFGDELYGVLNDLYTGFLDFGK